MTEVVHTKQTIFEIFQKRIEKGEAMLQFGDSFPVHEMMQAAADAQADAVAKGIDPATIRAM